MQVDALMTRGQCGGVLTCQLALPGKDGPFNKKTAVSETHSQMLVVHTWTQLHSGVSINIICNLAVWVY